MTLKTPHGRVAVEFASALVDGEFERAHALLVADLQRRLGPDDLRQCLFDMFVDYASGLPTSIRIDEQPVCDDWPGKLPEDIGWAYVSIEGEDFVEAVTVIVTDVKGQHLIRDVEWGRP